MPSEKSTRSKIPNTWATMDHIDTINLAEWLPSTIWHSLKLNEIKFDQFQIYGV